MGLRPTETTLSIAISSRALFDLDESNAIFEQEGMAAYHAHQRSLEKIPLEPGVAFPLVQKLLALNTYDSKHRLVEVILVSRNSADTGLRVFNSIEHHGLDIVRGTFTNGQSPYAYLKAFGAKLFLSLHPEDVHKALQAGCASALFMPPGSQDPHPEQLRIAFDGDCVLFADEAERVYQTEGLHAFITQEKAQADQPLNPGPFKPFLEALHHLQTACPTGADAPIRTALVTARSAPAHERVVKTLRAWGVHMDEAHFLGGLEKGAFLKAFGADVFFDDHLDHCTSASEHVSAGLVPYGVRHDGSSIDF